ncbi:MAG: hypothetical protein Q8S33_16945 [Myxococcales bacterium]|nr:hypothetical protein [Myxococcales bacterium]
MTRSLSPMFVLLLAAGCRCGGGGTTSTNSTVRVEVERLSFGARFVGTTTTRALTLTNTGRASVPMTITTAAPFAVTPTEATVPGGASLEVTVSFAPSAAGPATGSLLLTGAEQSSVALDGEGREVPSCPPAESCSRARFDTTLEQCVVEQEPDDTPCTNACLVDARCVAGTCRGSVASSCDDQNACTVDSCGADSACAHSPLECRVTEACSAAFCDPASGCGSVPLEDGTPCGPATCRRSSVCINAACVVRDNPGAADVCTAVDLAAAGNSSCMLTRADTLRCWGFGIATWSPLAGQWRIFSQQTTMPRAGRPTTLSLHMDGQRPVPAPCTALAGGGFECSLVVDAGAVTEVAENGVGTCWLNPAGVVTCLPPRCRLIDGGFGACDPRLVTGPPGAETNVAHLSTANDAFCAVRTDGGVVCWGFIPDLLDGGSRGRAEVVMSRPVRAWRRGFWASCARFDDGFECRKNRPGAWWQPLPSAVVEAVPAVFGSADVLAVLRDGGLEACEDDGGAWLCRQAIDAGLPAITKVAAGNSHQCFLTGAGDVGCVGDNFVAQLGDISGAAPGVTPVPGVRATLLARSVSWRGMGALQGRSGFVAWGGGLGVTPVAWPTDAPRDLVVSPLGACVVERDGGVVCRIDGATVPMALPSAVERFSDCNSNDHYQLNAFGPGVRCSFFLDGGMARDLRPYCQGTFATSEVCFQSPRVTCNTMVDAGVRCRGSNERGQLGTGMVSGTSERAIEGLGPVVKVGMSAYQVCALEKSGRVLCWGFNVGAQTVSAPRALPLLPFARDLVCGDRHCCVLVGENGVSCWGANDLTQLGRDVPASDTPVAVPMPRRVEQLMAWVATTCARLSDGEVWCWGENRFGERGTASLVWSSSPVWVTQ